MKLRMSDLIVELENWNSALPVHAPEHKDHFLHGFKITRSVYSGEAYSTVSSGNIQQIYEGERRELIRCIAELINEHTGGVKMRSVLVVGLGNAAITADSLGPEVASRISVTDGLLMKMGFPKICAITPGTPARTGIDSARITLKLAEETGADLIIAVDSLCAISPERLGRVIQISEGGITPGSAFSHSSGEISSRTMPCPVLSIGVPTVIRASALSPDAADPNLLVSPADGDILIARYASVIAGGINTSLLGNKSSGGISRSLAEYD